MLLRICMAISSIFCLSNILMAMELDSSAKYAACVAQYKALGHYLPHAPLLRHVARMHLYKVLEHNKNMSHKLIAAALAAAATCEPRVNANQARLILLLANGDRVPLNAAHANFLYKHSQVLNDMHQDMEEGDQDELALPYIADKEQADLLITYLSDTQLARNKYIQDCTLADTCALAKTIEFLNIQELDNSDAIVQSIAEMIVHKLTGNSVSVEDQSQVYALPLEIQRRVVRKVLELTGLYAALHADHNSNHAIPCIELQEHRNLSSAASSVSWSPDGKYIASSFNTVANDNAIKIWNTTTNTCIQTIGNHDFWASSASWSPDSKYIASGFYDKTVKVWDIQSGTCIHTLIGHTDYANSVSWSPDGKYIASGSLDKTIKIWNIQNSTCIHTLTSHTDRISSISWSPDSKFMASSSHNDSTIKIWNTITGTHIYTLTGHTHWISSVSWSYDGKHIASGSWDGTIRIWDAQSGTCIHILKGYTDYVNLVAWSPDSKHIAISGEGDIDIRVLDATTGTYIQTLAGHNKAVKSVSWSPNSKYIASGSTDYNVKVWQWIDPAFDKELINEISLENIFAIAKSKKLLSYLPRK